MDSRIYIKLNEIAKRCQPLAEESKHQQGVRNLALHIKSICETSALTHKRLANSCVTTLALQYASKFNIALRYDAKDLDALCIADMNEADFKYLNEILVCENEAFFDHLKESGEDPALLINFLYGNKKEEK